MFEYVAVLTDALAGEIRSFSVTGEHLASLGGIGEGPGEFSNSVSLLRVAGDSIWAWDQRQQRVSVFARSTRQLGEADSCFHS